MALLMQWNCIGIGMTHAYVANWGDQLKDAQKGKAAQPTKFRGHDCQGSPATRSSQVE